MVSNAHLYWTLSWISYLVHLLQNPLVFPPQAETQREWQGETEAR